MWSTLYMFVHLVVHLVQSIFLLPEVSIWDLDVSIVWIILGSYFICILGIPALLVNPYQNNHFIDNKVPATIITTPIDNNQRYLRLGPEEGPYKSQAFVQTLQDFPLTHVSQNIEPCLQALQLGKLHSACSILFSPIILKPEADLKQAPS